MANREALRELQSRLAGRLQAARTEGAQSVSWLAVLVGGRHYLVPLALAGEIFSWPGVLPVPYAQPWFWGVANLRGSLTGVVDLAALLGHAQPRSEQALGEASLLALNPVLDVNAALVVDRLLGLRGADAFVERLEPEPGTPPSLGSVYLDAQGGRWQELQLQQLVQTPEFLNVRT